MSLTKTQREMLELLAVSPGGAANLNGFGDRKTVADGLSQKLIRKAHGRAGVFRITRLGKTAIDEMRVPAPPAEVDLPQRERVPLTPEQRLAATSPFWIEHDPLLRQLAAEGLTTAEAAARMGVTKSKVIGRASRLGIQWARSPDGEPRKTRVPLATFPPASHCVFPIGDPRRPGFRFCGDLVCEPGDPYCAQHQAITHIAGSRQASALAAIERAAKRATTLTKEAA